MDYTGTHKIASLASIFIPSPKKVKNGKGLQIEALINVFIVVYDSEGNLTEDLSKELKILYDWRGMPIEFIQQSQPTGSSSDTLFRLLMKYDGTGRRISRIRLSCIRV